MNYTALIVAAGSGSRMGLGYNKLLFKLKSGYTIVEETVNVFLRDEKCKQIIVVASYDDMETYMRLCSCGHVVFVAGGATRQESVYNGLLAVREQHVLIHDGARPWVKQESIDNLLECLTEHKACLLMVPAKDTIKTIENGIVKETLKRDMLWQAQTPQAFDTHLILSCYRKAMMQGVQATDDAQVVEKCSDEAISVVEGDYENIKVTTMDDVLDR